jgi:hypothetical protein
MVVAGRCPGLLLPSIRGPYGVPLSGRHVNRNGWRPPSGPRTETKDRAACFS